VDCSTVPSQQHNNPIIFRDGTWPYHDSVNALGLTMLTIDTDTGEIYGADIEINSTMILVAQPPAPVGAYDLASILTHEAGHFLGLAHSADTTAVMYAFYHPGSTTLALDDIAGICSIYPPDGTRTTAAGPIAATTCDDTPRKGFSTSCDGLDAGADYVDGAVFPDDAAEPGGDGGDSGPCKGLFTCALTMRQHEDCGGLAACCGVLLLGAIARRSRWAPPRSLNLGRARTVAIVLGAMLATLGASAIGARAARASVSIAVLLEELVQRASAVAVVTPDEQRSLWEGDRIVTLTRVHVDRKVSGRLAGDVWVRTLGGAVGKIAQLVEGEALFAIGRPSLVFLRPHVDAVTLVPTGAMSVVERAQGQFPLETDAQGRSRLTLASDLGALVPPSGRAPRGGAFVFAREVLDRRSVDEGAGVITAAWRKIHPE
jgi:hypothetical protein